MYNFLVKIDNKAIWFWCIFALNSFYRRLSSISSYHLMLQSIQRLNREVEVLQREREDLQQALSEAKCKQPEPQVHTDADYKYLESKLKVRFQSGFNYYSRIDSGLAMLILFGRWLVMTYCANRWRL